MRLPALMLATVFQCLSLCMQHPNEWVMFAGVGTTATEKGLLTEALYHTSELHGVNLTFKREGNICYCCYVVNEPEPVQQVATCSPRCCGGFDQCQYAKAM